MTMAMHSRFVRAVRQFRSVFPDQYVHNWKFRHYGKYYRIEENEIEFRVYLVNSNDIHDTLIEIITK